MKNRGPMKALILRPEINIPFEALMPEEIGEKWVCFPSVGSLYVREYARKAGFLCDYLDAEALGLSPEKAAEKAGRGGYDVIALPADTYSFLSTIKQAGEIRKTCPDALIVCGGVHPTIYPEQTAMLPEFDAVVFGDGERPFLALLQALENGKEIAGIPGVAVSTEQGVIKGPVPDFENDLDTLGFPDYSDLPLDKYFSSLAKARPVMPVVTSRGCPFKCTFCDRPRLAGKLRFRSADHVIKELEHLVSLGVTEFSFYDDTFTANKKRALKILDSIRKMPRKIGFDVRSRVDTTDEQLLRALADAGCERVYIGIETGDPEMQKRIRKNLDLDKARQAVAMTQKAGLKALAYFMLGLPGETKAQAGATIEYAGTLKADYYLFEVFVPMPCTQAYEQGIAAGILPGDYWANYAASPNADFSPPLWEENLNADELARLIRTAYRRCYLTPSYIFRSAIKTATWEEFLQKAKGALSFIRLLK